MLQLLRKLFDTSDRDVKSIFPTVERINALEDAVASLTDDDLRHKAPQWRARLVAGETLEQLLPEVFAVVRESSRRTLGMRQFDVQLIGGVVLHQGRIAEMKTGEGKTLVAVAPLVLNTLTGKGVHLVTVNDYLARRDAVWMGPIYHFLGLSVGIIQGQSADSDELGGSYLYTPGTPHEDPRYMNLTPISRREAYLCDIVYGTNHEFGFDYLRDNMAFEIDQLSQTALNFAIVDEVDSILIDEARTPHIISGPSNDDVSVYRVVDQLVRQLIQGEPDQSEVPGIHYVGDKKNHSASLTEEGMDLIEQMLGIDNIATDPKLFHHVNASVKAYALFQKDVDYVVRGSEVVIVDENTGRMMFGRRYSDGLHQALEAKEGATVQRESQTVAVITFQNLFRLYEKLAGMTGTAKTEEDEFRKIYGLDVVTVPTHRAMVREDQEDVVYKSLEGKMRGIARELLRLYSKQQPVLVGTRSIDMSEVVSNRLTSEMLQKLVLIDRLYDKKENDKGISKETKGEIQAIVDTDFSDIKKTRLSAAMQLVNVSGDPLNKEHWTWFQKQHKLPDEAEHYFEEAMKHGVPHNVLNAKYHEREALIISEAGRKGAITIATNMAGRGVDILLGGRVADEIVTQSRREEAAEGEGGSHYMTEYANTFANYRRGGQERAAPPLPLDDQERRGLAEEVRVLGGLYILGTERHESRRIDNQLRGRSGRQGDPGMSRFYVSLEDQLWKIFNAKMLENPLLKAWPPMEEVKAGFLSKMILKTQERIENHYFEARKHVLEYDDVLNSQREHVYGMRREILLGKDCSEDLLHGIDEILSEMAVRYAFVEESGRPGYDYASLYESLNSMMPFVDYATLSDLEAVPAGTELLAFCKEVAHREYDRKKADVGDEMFGVVQQKIMLQAVNDRWMEHLQLVEYIREGIGLRGYGQVDPLVAYKRETYDLFQITLKQIRDQSVRLLFLAHVQVEAPAPAPNMLRLEDSGDGTMVATQTAAPVSDGQPGKWPENMDPKRVGRNDLCPCGSGRKFKSCHYPQFRAQGSI